MQLKIQKLKNKMTKHYAHTKKWKHCVKKVKAKRTPVNPYAVCTARLGRRESLRRK